MKKQLTSLLSGLLIVMGIITPSAVPMLVYAAVPSFAMTSLTSACVNGLPQVTAAWNAQPNAPHYILERQYPVTSTTWEDTAGSYGTNATDATWQPGFDAGSYKYRVVIEGQTAATAPLSVTLACASPTPAPAPIPVPAPTPTPTPTPTPVGIPDMIVTALTMNPASPTTGVATTFSATIKNQGTGATPLGVKNGVAFLIDGTSVTWSDNNTTSLAPGASVVVTANGGPANATTWVATGGTHTLDAWVNDIARYPETNTTNNHLTRTFAVSGSSAPIPTPTPTPTPTPAPVGIPDMIVTALTMNPASPTTGVATTFSATIKNQGTGATPLGVKNGVAFLIDGTSVTWSDNNTTSLAPGASVVVTANGGPANATTWVATGGTHTLDAWVNDIARYPETNTTNNHLTRTFSVSGGTPAPTPTPTPAPTPTPQTGLEWGAYNGDTASAPTQMESLVGQNINLVATFSGWGDSFPSQFSSTVGSQGKTLVVFWEQFGVSLDQIINGSQDAYILQYANQAKSYGGSVMLAPFHEMNGSWTPWCGCNPGNSPDKVIAAWRHIHDLFGGASNVKFAWNVNSNSVPNTAANAIANYYPGDAYVDYVSVDGFNFGSPWVSFSEIFNAPLAQLETYNKPIYILSIASAEGSAKAAWINDAFTVQIPKHPKIVGWVWFNVNKEANWLVNSDPNALAAFKAALPK